MTTHQHSARHVDVVLVGMDRGQHLQTAHEQVDALLGLRVVPAIVAQTRQHGRCDTHMGVGRWRGRCVLGEGGGSGGLKSKSCVRVRVCVCVCCCLEAFVCECEHVRAGACVVTTRENGRGASTRSIYGSYAPRLLMTHAFSMVSTPGESLSSMFMHCRSMVASSSVNAPGRVICPARERIQDMQDRRDGNAD
jgi:hypothetical protein